MAGQVERDRPVAGGERVQDGSPHPAVECQTVKEHERRAERALVTMSAARETGPPWWRGSSVSEL